MTSNDSDDFSPNEDRLEQKLNLETGKLSWPELARHFARGMVIVVTPELNLIEVATRLAGDDKSQFESWLANKQIWRANDEDAIQWQSTDPQFWSVVVAPWVLVQEIRPATAQ